MLSLLLQYLVDDLEFSVPLFVVGEFDRHSSENFVTLQSHVRASHPKCVIDSIAQHFILLPDNLVLITVE